MTLYGPKGERLTESSLTTGDPGVYGGWLTSAGTLSPNSLGAGSFTALRVNREVQRRAARIAYLTNPLLYGAVEVIHGFVLGTGVTLGEITDKRAATAINEFWQENTLDHLLSRMFTEYLLDGESLTVWPLDGTGLGRDLPAHIALADVDRGVTLDVDPFDSTLVTGATVQSVIAGGERRFTQGQYLWKANDALWNDPRGWPVVMRAVPACLAYTGFLERRLRLHDIQSRINGVYKAFATTYEEHRTKAAAFGRIPADGQILTLAKNPVSGESEQFDFVTQKIGAADAATDARLIRLLVAVALNLPEHQLGESGNANLATASAMDTPARKGFERKQRWVEQWLRNVLRTELERRYGAGQLYTVTDTKVTPDGLGKVVTRRKVTARQLNLPISFPSLDDSSLLDLIAKVQAASALGLASRGTLSGEMGYNWPDEAELLAAQKAAEPPPPVPANSDPTKTPPDAKPGVKP